MADYKNVTKVEHTVYTAHMEKIVFQPGEVKSITLGTITPILGVIELIESSEPNATSELPKKKNSIDLTRKG